MHDDTRSWLGNEANSIIKHKRQIASRNRKPVIEPVHEDDPTCPIYYAKHLDPGHQSVALQTVARIDILTRLVGVQNHLDRR